jgi:hypothetical protein
MWVSDADGGTTGQLGQWHAWGAVRALHDEFEATGLLESTDVMAGDAALDEFVDRRDAVVRSEQAMSLRGEMGHDASRE